jgi:very-short-patch-repair endonuclease
VPVTRPERTLLDLGAVADTDRVELALEDSLRRGLTSLRRLHEIVATQAGSRTAGVRALRNLLELRLDDAATESHLETRFVQFVRRHELPMPSRQHVAPIAVAPQPRLDLAYPWRKVAIEVDGFKHHSGRSAWRRDRIRLTALAAAGWRVIHVTEEDLRGSRGERKAEEIRVALGMSRS